MPGRPYNLLIFDWDGTLSDSAAIIVTALKAAAQALDLEALEDTRLRSIIGLSLEEAARELHGITGADAVRFADAYRTVFLDPGRPGVPLFPGTHDALKGLHAAGYVIAIATGKGRRGLDRELGASGLAPLVHHSRCADETRSKPHPLMVEELLTDTDCAPAAALVIGDTDFDLDMARAAGVDGLAVTCGNHSHERLAVSAPVAVLDDVQQLPAWLMTHGQSPTSGI